MQQYQWQSSLSMKKYIIMIMTHGGKIIKNTADRLSGQGR